jgi:hypothetical protein
MCADQNWITMRSADHSREKMTIPLTNALWGSFHSYIKSDDVARWIFSINHKNRALGTRVFGDALEDVGCFN